MKQKLAKIIESGIDNGLSYDEIAKKVLSAIKRNLSDKEEIEYESQPRIWERDKSGRWKKMYDDDYMFGFNDCLKWMKRKLI